MLLINGILSIVLLVMILYVMCLLLPTYNIYRDLIVQFTMVIQLNPSALEPITFLQNFRHICLSLSLIPSLHEQFIHEVLLTIQKLGNTRFHTSRPIPADFVHDGWMGLGLEIWSNYHPSLHCSLMRPFYAGFPMSTCKAGNYLAPCIVMFSKYTTYNIFST